MKETQPKQTSEQKHEPALIIFRDNVCFYDASVFRRGVKELFEEIKKRWPHVFLALLTTQPVDQLRALHAPEIKDLFRVKKDSDVLLVAQDCANVDGTYRCTQDIVSTLNKTGAIQGPIDPGRIVMIGCVNDMLAGRKINPFVVTIGVGPASNFDGYPTDYYFDTLADTRYIMEALALHVNFGSHKDGGKKVEEKIPPKPKDNPGTQKVSQAPPKRRKRGR